MQNIIKILKFFLLFGFLGSAISIFVIFSALWKYAPELPNYDKILNYKPDLSSRVYTSDGILLKSYFKEERIYVPINRIPKTIIHAFISAEDKKFYSHIGIDILAIIRAIISNILSSFSNSKLIGASTITQQVVKNLLLSNEISYERKIKEILLAIRIENILEKDEILELYLNDIYLGFGSYGIASASLNYFDKSLNELQLHEIAFLAALPKAPNNYHPILKYKEALERRNWVIKKMYENNYITKEDLNYTEKPINIKKRTELAFTKGDYFYEEIRKNLYNQYGEKKLYEEGLVIKTTINTKLQEIAEQSLINGLIEYDKRHGWRGVLENFELNKFKNEIEIFHSQNPFPNNWFPVILTVVKNNNLKAIDENNNNFLIKLTTTDNLWLDKIKFKVGDVIFVEQINDIIIIRQIPKVNGAILVLDPHTGDIMAMSGGLSFRLSEFNRATQAKRQPGSAFKPLVYISALKEGYTPSTLILDAPYVIDQGPGLPKWKPANYTEEFFGLTTMRTGIEKSRNLMTIRLADKIGMQKILKTVKDFEIDKYIDDKLSMSLGSGLVSLLDLTNTYGIIVNGGNKISPKMIKSIYSKEGLKIYRSSNKECINCNVTNFSNKIPIPTIINSQKNILDPRIAYQVTSMLEGVVTRGTGRKLKDLNVPLAGKTGTTNDNKDAWFIGFSPDVVIGIYVGYDNPQSLGYKETGSSVALPIFKKFIKKANINSNKIPFRIPSGISFVKIDPKTGLPSNKKSSILEPFIIGTEPYNSKNLNILDSLGSINNNSISGTGGLLDN
ncbi:MAG: Penicillin-binding protein 1A [Alphaproteobacteria bacterium MarineAlpha5_Bin5]|nr:MAG: Penicillin-binding protein 1A [Alphaproteobacteria bacterium MarineAlpha5_Bin5]PPR51145.1 MAG: Penicillin-binding protein 1A [Alphaproteobacteria bacterium MarineAlpha5_Bin4]